MMFTKKTIRNFPPMSRRIAKDINNLELAIRHLKKELESISSNEREVTAWINRQKYYAGNGGIDLLLPKCQDCPTIQKSDCLKYNITPSATCPAAWKSNSIIAKISKKG